MNNVLIEIKELLSNGISNENLIGIIDHKMKLLTFENYSNKLKEFDITLEQKEFQIVLIEEQKETLENFRADYTKMFESAAANINPIFNPDNIYMTYFNKEVGVDYVTRLRNKEYIDYEIEYTNPSIVLCTSENVAKAIIGQAFNVIDDKKRLYCENNWMAYIDSLSVLSNEDVDPRKIKLEIWEQLQNVTEAASRG